MKEFIDASVFLGMNSKNEKIRISCKNYFVSRLKSCKKILISLEQVGMCDNIIWKFPRQKQDEYYPFMDNLHTLMKMKRLAYNQKDFLEDEKQPSSLNFTEKMTLGMVLSRKGILYTINPKLLGLKLSFIKSPKLENVEFSFPNKLEALYRRSLVLRI